MNTLSDYPIEDYSPERIQEAFLIVHPNVLERYGITRDKFHGVFEEGSNFWRLKTPITNNYGNEFWDSEGHYMAQRFSELGIKKEIAEASKEANRSKRAAYNYEDKINKDQEDRIRFMRESIKQKFTLNLRLQDILVETQRREIIELTYWGDRFFGISHHTRDGRNILGKQLTEYRDTL